MLSQDWPQLDQYVDYRDRDHTWQVGLVIFKNQHCLKIRSEGWSMRYDEIIPLTDETSKLKNTRLQPFRSNIRGYTGSRKCPGLREHWKYSTKDHESRLQKLIDFIQTLKSHSPEQLIQFLRGQHYFYIDFLMCNTYTELEDVVKVYDYFQQHIVLLQGYISSILQRGVQETFINQLNISKKEQVWDQTYDNCYYQLAQALFNISGLQDRLSFFIRNNEEHIKEVVGMCQKHEHYISTQIQTAKLYDSIIDLISTTHQALFSSMKDVKVPFAFGFSLFQLFQVVENIFRLEGVRDKAAETFEKLFFIIDKLTEQIDPSDMKQVQIDKQLEHILLYLRSTASRYKKDEIISIWPQRIRIKICLLLLRCDKLQKKIKGINKLKELAERITKQQFFNLNQQEFNQFLHSFKIFEELFIHNEHVELYKKSIEFIGYLYKFDMVTVEEIIFIWNSSINKHPMIVTLLFQFWIEVAYLIQFSDLDRYAYVAVQYYRENNENSHQFYDFFFDLILSIISNNIKGPENKGYEAHNQKIVNIVKGMIVVAYEILLKTIDQPYFPMLISKYGSIVVESQNCQKIIMATYKNLTKNDEVQVSLQLLNEVYVNQDRIDAFIPDDFGTQLISCLKLPKITLKEVNLILSIINSIITFSNRRNLSPQEFQQLWVYFQGAAAPSRLLFFEWILPLKSQQISDNITIHLNLGFNHDLKKYILNTILTSPSHINYQTLSKKELSIILQTLIDVNFIELRIQKKKGIEGYRFIYRIKTVELIHQEILWSIFQKCKNQDVVQYLNRYIIKFYFNLSPALSEHLRKSRIDAIMEKIIHNIKESKPSDTRILKNSLLLLKNIFELVKEEELYFHSLDEQPKPFCSKVQVKHLGFSYKIETPENETIMQLKCRLAHKFKLRLRSFKLMMKEEDHYEEIDFVYKNLPISILRKASIQIVSISQHDETVSKFVASFIDQDIEIFLIGMLQKETIATEVFMVIEQLQLKLDYSEILKKIDKILETEQKDNRKTMNIQIYYHLLQLKIYSKMLDTEEQILPIVTSHSFQRILVCMKYPISEHYQINFLYKIIPVLDKIFKKMPKNSKNTIRLLQYIFSSLHEITVFILKHLQIDANVKEYAIKIAQNAIYIIDRQIIGDNNVIHFLISQKKFTEFFELIYLNGEVQEVRMFFTEKIKIRLLFSGKNHKIQFSENAQKIILSLFIDNMYFKVKEQELSLGSVGTENDAVSQFCYLLALVICDISSDRFEKTQVISPIPGKSISLYEESLNFIDSLKLFTTSDFHWNNLLGGHFHILSAIFRQKPSLLSSDIINFALKNSLALSSQNIYEPLCKKIDHINEVFRFLAHILLFNTEAKYIKLIVDTLKPCHGIELWRCPPSLHWSVNNKREPKQAYRGLFNPGCICYMNSLLQQLFMIDDFRLSILALGKSSDKMTEQREISGSQETEKLGFEQSQNETEKAMLQSLKQIFLKLQFSQQNYINPSIFARTLKTNDKRQMIKFNEQMDIDEFASIFFEKIQKGIKESNSDNFVNSLFGGVYAHEIISKECCHTSEREEKFISISLEVKENIIKSFESLVKTQILDGANKYHCQKCDKKVRAEKVQTIKQLPPYLILCLKRFEFDYDIDAKIKINDYCQFPQNLNLLEYSQQQILKNKSDYVSEEDQNQSLPPDYFDYHLKGVVVHTGSADSGHYYSLIDNQKGSWHEFNDEDVLPFDLDRMPEEAFGCRSERYDLKTKNAYLLIYQRKTHRSKKKDQQERILKREEHSLLIEKIMKKNRQIRKFQIIFSQDYECLVDRIELNLSQISNNIDIQISWFEYELSFYFLVKARKESVQSFLDYSKKILNKIQLDHSFCIFFLNIFSSPKFIEEFFVYNPIREKCKIVGFILAVAMEKEYRCTKDRLSLEKNEHLFKVLSCFNAIFICHSPIWQLLTVLRKFLDIIIKQEDMNSFFKILENFDFCQIIFNHAFNVSFDKKIRTEKEQYSRSSQWDIPFLSPLTITGRKLHQNNHGQAWKISAMLLNLCNQFLQMNENQTLQIRDLYLNKINYLRSIFKEPNIQTKIHSLILESSSQKALYYFYYSLKELNLHLSIIPFFEKALKDYQSIKYRPFFLYLQVVINDTEVETAEKIKIIDIIEKGYRANEKYFLETDIIHQWILKFASTSQQFLQILDSRRTFTQDIYDRISRNPSPNIPDLNKKFKHQIMEKIINRINGIIISTESKDYETNSLWMKRQYEKIINLNYSARLEYSPPQDNFFVGQKIELFDCVNYKWKIVTVVENKLGQLKLQQEGAEQLFYYFWEDSQKIRKILPGREMEHQPSQAESDLSYPQSSSSSVQNPIQKQ